MNERQELQPYGGSQDLMPDGGQPAGAPAARSPGVPRAVARVWEAHARLRIWEEGVIFGAVVLIILSACVVWGVVMLSDGYTPEVREQLTKLITHLVTLLLGLLAGKSLWGKK